MESLGCTQLSTLTFDGIFLDVFSSQKRGFAWIPDFLGALDPLQLVSVTFRCILEDRNDIFAFPFLELDEALSHEDFRSLSRVTFVVCGLYTLTQSVIYKFMDMPRLKDRGLLRLEWGNY